MTAEGPEDPEEQARSSRLQVRVVLSIVFLVSLGQATLHPVLAPLSRELGLLEWQAGAILSVSSAMMVLTSRFWGRRSQAVGPKPVLIGCALAASFALFLFAAASHFGMIGLLSGALLWTLLLATRGIVFGTAAAATMPTAQAYIADVTTSEEERVRGMASIGAVQGLSMIGGSVIGGLLAGISLIASLVIVPFLPLVATLFGAKFLRPQQRSRLIANPKKVRASDGRVWPFLIVSLGVFMVYNTIQITAGFLIQDRYGVDEKILSFVIGATLLTAGIGMLLAQGFIVPKSGWSPATLMRVGSCISAVGFVVALLPVPLPVFVVCVFLAGLGTGVAIPGAISAPTLLFGREEQGGLAGTLNSVNGIAFMVTPLLATSLYSVAQPLPGIWCAVLICAVAVYAFVNPTVGGRRGRGA